MKNHSILFVFVVILLVSFTSAYISLPVQPIVGGQFQPDTIFSFTHNLTESSDCSNVVATFSNTVTTRSNGVAYIELNTSNLTNVPNYLCEYRDGTLRRVMEYTDLINNNIFAQNITLDGYFNASNGNITASGFYYPNGSSIGPGGNLSFNQSHTDTLYLRNTGDLGAGDYVWVGDFNMTGIHRYSFSPSSEIPINTGNVSAGNGINDSGSSGAGTRNWSNPTNIASSDNAYASLNLLGVGVKTAWLRSNNNGFSLPSTASGCQITGIIGLIERKQTNTGDAVVNDSAVRIFDENGNPVGDNKASSTVWGSTDKVIVYGSSTDDWNAGMTCDGFNSNNSGLGVVAQTILNLGAGGAPAVDEMKLIIYYTTSNGWYSTGAIDSIDSYAISPYASLTTANSTYFNTSGDVKTWGNFYANNGSEKVCTSENGLCNQTGFLTETQGDYLYNNGTDIFFNSTLNNETITQIAQDSGGGAGGWTLTSTSVYNNTAGVNVSIGTSETTHKFTVSGDSNFTGTVILGENINLLDGKKINFGNSEDAGIYWDGTNNVLIIGAN